MFIGREFELSTLERLYKSDSFQLPVIYGRRRVGKTALINEFCKNKKFIYFVAIQSNAKGNLENLSHQILDVLAPNAPKSSFSTFFEAFEYVFANSFDERIIFAIDEYPYLAESEKSVSSVLQAIIDKYYSSSKLFLILCGSSMSFMEKQVLGYQSPLYGRRTAQFKIVPFNYYESSKMYSNFTNEEKITLYSITGGVPEYLSRIDNNLSLQENVYNLFFNTAGRLFEEPTNLLKQELRSPETYNAIILAIATGSSRLNEIATKAGIETSQCSTMLSTLIGLNIVRKEHPVTEVNSKKTIYILEDLMFIFWYRFVLPEMSRITVGFGEDVCKEVFDKHLSSHVGHAFEECSKQYMWRLHKNNKIPFSFSRIGRWWGNNKKERCEEEIDFIAYSNDKAIFGECKWQNETTDFEVWTELYRRSNLFSEFTDKYYFMFSKSGFSKSLSELSKKERVSLINVNDMFDD